MNANRLALAACCLTFAPAALAQNLVFNSSFETNDGGTPEGWSFFNTAQLRTLGDGGTPAAVARTGTASIEFPSGTDFSGCTTNVFNPNTLEFYDPAYTWQGGDVTVTGWYYIPSDMPLVDANAGIKLEFRRDNSSIATAFESLSISGHTNDQWVEFEMTVTDQQMMDAAGAFPPFATSVTVLPLRFGASSSTGTVFFDDIELTQGADECLADTNGDGIVSPADFSAWVAAFNAQAPACDQNDDGVCSPADFSAWVANYNAGCP